MIKEFILRQMFRLKKTMGILYPLINRAVKVMLIKFILILNIILIIIFPLRAMGADAEQFQWIVKPEFEQGESFSEGMAAVMTGGGYGYINSSGEIVIKPVYVEAGDFYDGFAPVMSNGLPVYINHKGVQVIAVKMDERRYFGEGLAAVKINGKYGYLTADGKQALKPVYEYALPFNEGLAAVKINGKYGFINKKGKIIIRPVYEKASGFSEGFAAVRINGAWGYINRKGAVVIKAVYAEAGYFRSGSAPVKGSSGFGYINSRGSFIIEPQFESAAPFSENLAAVKLNGKWGYIKRTSGRRETVKKRSHDKNSVRISESVKEASVDNTSNKKKDVVQKKKDVKPDKEFSVNKQTSVINQSGTTDRVIKGAGLNDYTTGGNIRDEKNSRIEEKTERTSYLKLNDNNRINTDKNIPVIKGMEYVGILSEVNEGQVIVTDFKTGAKVYLGAWCITKVDEDKVYLEAGTPFSTVAKCDFRNGFYEKIKPGMKVYKKNK